MNRETVVSPFTNSQKNFQAYYYTTDTHFSIIFCLFWIMCRIPGTWHDYSTVNIIIEVFCQHRKKKILAATVEELFQ